MPVFEGIEGIEGMLQNCNTYHKALTNNPFYEATEGIEGIEGIFPGLSLVRARAYTSANRRTPSIPSKPSQRSEFGFMGASRSKARRPVYQPDAMDYCPARDRMVPPLEAAVGERGRKPFD